MSGKKARIEVNYDEAGKVLKSDEMQDILLQCANQIAGQVSGNYQTDLKRMPTRYISSVFTTDKKTIQDNLDNNTLLKGCHL